MRANPPVLSAAERNARRDAKRQILIEFLADHEVYTSVQIAQLLLQCSRTVAYQTLVALQKSGALKSEEHQIDGRITRLFGITPHGLAIADRVGNPHFELGRTNSDYVTHKLEGQRMRVRAAGAGWGRWVPERELRKTGLKKVPDAMVTDLAGRKIAVEIERYCKTPKRYEELIREYVKAIRVGRYDLVHFVCPPGIERLVERCMNRVTTIDVDGETHIVEEKHRKRFRYFSFDNWPPAPAGAGGQEKEAA